MTPSGHGDPVAIRHWPDRCSFEVIVEGHRCSLDYRREGDTLIAFHTGVARALQGRGLAARLVSALFDHAREAGLRVVPRCSYVATWVRRHPEVSDLLAL